MELPPPGKLLKYTMYLHKNGDLNETEFHEHWRTTHASFAVEALARNGIVRYTQYHCSSASRALARPMTTYAIEGSGLVSGLQIMDYDAIVEIWVRRMEDFLAALKEPVFTEKIVADEKLLFDMENAMVTVGWEEDMILEGKVVMQT
ncbi:hypothetical protein MMC08_002318 [Hypocenomyce scalaris]|nr:hypothetical protein [Hypocenomyce scalaris]